MEPWKDEAVRFVSSTSHWALVAFLLAGCAGSAPPLPKDYGSVDAAKPSLSQFDAEVRQLTCEEIDAELETLHMQETLINQEIAGERGGNQAIGFVAGLAFPVLLPLFAAADFHGDEKDALELLNKRRDTLLTLEVAKDCPS